MIIRNSTVRSDVLLTSTLPMVTSFKPIVQYHNQDTDIVVVKIQNISITTMFPNISFIPTPASFYPQSLLYPC